LNFKKLKARIWDSGGHGVEHAVRLARDFGTVEYYTPWQKMGPTLDERSIGNGVEGVTRIQQFLHEVDSVDLFYFVDAGAGDMAQMLRDGGHRVFGAGDAERLEFDRMYMRKIQSELGLPTQHTVKIKGCRKLQEYLAKHKHKVVKVDVVRGDIESFISDDLFRVDQQIHKLKFDFGPFKDDFEFVVEEKIDGHEIGFDCFFNGTDFVLPYLWGLEHEYAYLGRYVWELPTVLRPVMSALRGVLAAYDYRGAISVECRCPSASKAYLIDMTCRYPFPLSLIYTESMKNYSEVIWGVAGGEAVKIEPAGAYVGMCSLLTHYTEKAWTMLEVEEKNRAHVKMERFAKFEGKYYAVRGEDNGFTLIAAGDSRKRVVNDIKESVDDVNCYGLEKDTIGQIDAADEEIDALSEIGAIL
jgi:hypothetical protein